MPALVSDFLRPARLRAEQERALGDYLAFEVRAFSDHYGPLLEAKGWARGRGRGLAELADLPVTEPDSFTDPSALVLRPDAEKIRRAARPGMRARLRAAELTGGREQFGRSRIDPVFKPVRWTVDDGLLVASSTADLDRLAELGRRWLEAAGVRPSDSLVSMLEPGPTLAFGELELGARRAGLSSVFLPAPPSPAELEQLRPEVLVGGAADLTRLLASARGEDRDLHHLRTVIAIGAPLRSRDRRLLQGLAPRAAVLQAWAPPGVRSLWFECRGGAGLHTHPGAEIIEVVVPPDDRPAAPRQYGDLLWTALGWRGSVAVRLRTGLLGQLDTSVCSACGRGSPRIRVPGFIEVLEDADDVAEWQAALYSGEPGGRDELVVYVAPVGKFSDRKAESLAQGLRDRLDAAGHPGTQFVVESASGLTDRLSESQGARLIDYRE